MLPRFLEDLNPDIYMSDNYIVLDKEVTNYDKGSAGNRNNRHLLTVWTHGQTRGKYILERCNEYELRGLLERIERADFLVAHNAKFELQWLAREGLDLTKVLVFDTMLAEYVLLGNRKKPLNLDAMGGRYGVGAKSNYISTCIKSGICPSELPQSLLAKYCVQDVKLTEKIFLAQREALRNKSLLPVLFTRCILTPVLADIEFNGMHLDKDEVLKEHKAALEQEAILRTELDILTGGINLRSPKQKAQLLYKNLKFAELRGPDRKPIRSDSGQPKTDTDTIKKLVCKTKRQENFKKVFLEWNLHATALSKTLEFFHGVVTETDDDVFYAQFNQAVTQTHRLSSSGKPVKFKAFPKSKSVQFQNFPRKYKRLFNARQDGWLIGERDGAQLEFRVAAYLGRDAVAASDIAEGFDVHSFTASILNDVSVEWMLANKDRDPVAKQYRQEAKADTFKPLYGGSSGSEKQQAYYRAFKEKYRGVADAQQEWIDTVLTQKKLVTQSGLIFYWPDTRMTQSGYVTNTTSICNYPVQSLATAEIIPIAVTYMWHRMKAAGLKAFIINTIHDSVITEEPPEEVAKINDIANQAFAGDVYNYLRKVYNIDFTVPLAVDNQSNNHWSVDL